MPGLAVSFNYYLISPLKYPGTLLLFFFREGEIIRVGVRVSSSGKLESSFRFHFFSSGYIIKGGVAISGGILMEKLWYYKRPHHATVANLAKICPAGFQKIVPHAAMSHPSPIQTYRYISNFWQMV